MQTQLVLDTYAYYVYEIMKEVYATENVKTLTKEQIVYLVGMHGFNELYINHHIIRICGVNDNNRYRIN